MDINGNCIQYARGLQVGDNNAIAQSLNVVRKFKYNKKINQLSCFKAIKIHYE